MQRQQRKRSRIPFSCSNCRHDKYRCDRGKPCISCVRRDKGSTCVYDERANLVVSNTRVPPKNNGGFRAFTINKEVPTHVEEDTQLTPPAPDFKDFGYAAGGHNILGVFKHLEDHGLSTDNPGRISDARDKSHVRLQSDKYLSLLRQIPSRSHVAALTEVFTNEFNWNYNIIDDNHLRDQIQAFYSSLRNILADDVSLEVLLFPALLFQVLACAVLFLPAEHDPVLDDLCIGRSFTDLAREYGNLSNSVLELFEKRSANLVSIQAGFLRVCFLKNLGHVSESWHTLSHIIIDAEEIGLDREDGKLTSDGSENICDQLWTIEIRRRTMLNLLLWDSQMGIVLGKTPTIQPNDWLIVLPMDTTIPIDRSSCVPIARKPREKPTPFTFRLVEYQLHHRVPLIRELAIQGASPGAYSTVKQIHQEALEFIDQLPPPYRFDNPDTTWDIECPWLPAQRSYLCSTTWFFLIELHKPYIFTLAHSRTETIKAGINMLRAQECYFHALKKHHHKQFVIAFFTLEAAVAVLAVLIAHPSENRQYVAEALEVVNAGVQRLNDVRADSALAGAGADIIQPLISRVQAEPELMSSLSPDIKAESDGSSLKTPRDEHEDPSPEPQQQNSHTHAQHHIPLPEKSHSLGSMGMTMATGSYFPDGAMATPVPGQNFFNTGNVNGNANLNINVNVNAIENADSTYWGEESFRLESLGVVSGQQGLVEDNWVPIVQDLYNGFSDYSYWDLMNHS